MSEMFRRILIVLLMVGIGVCAPDMCGRSNHPGYRCEGYGCYKTGDCSIGYVKGIVEDPSYSCKVGRLTYWEELSRTLPPMEECPGRGCQPSLLSRVSVVMFDGIPSISILFTVPPSSAKYHFYPCALSMKVDSIKSPAGGDRHSSVRLFRFDALSRHVERYLFFNCILQDERSSLTTLEFKVFSWKSSLNTEVHNLTKTLVYNVTVFPGHLREKDKIKTIAVAKYPFDNDLHVVFDEVSSPEVKLYRVKAVDKETGRQWGKTITVYQEIGNYSCILYGITKGLIQIEIDIEHKDGSISGPYVSHPVFFKDISSPTDDPIHGESSSLTTIAYSAVSAVVISSFLVALLFYCRRKKSHENPSHHVENPRVLLLYSNKREENASVAKSLVNFLKATFRGASFIYEGEEKEKSNLASNVPRWYQQKIEWASHVVVLWFPGAMEDPDVINAHEPIPHHFPTTLRSLLATTSKNAGRKCVVHIYYGMIIESSSITKMLGHRVKTYCMPKDFGSFFQNIMGRKFPNNCPYNEMGKIRLQFPDLHSSVEKAMEVYRPDSAKFESNSSGGDDADDSESTQDGISFIGNTDLVIDPYCPVHGHMKSNSEGQTLADNKDSKDSFNSKNEEDDVCRSSRVQSFDLYSPSDDDDVSLSSSKLEEAILSMNCKPNDEGEQMPLVNRDQSFGQRQNSQRRHETTRRDFRHGPSHGDHNNDEMQHLLNDLSQVGARVNNMDTLNMDTQVHCQPRRHQCPNNCPPQWSVDHRYNSPEGNRVHSPGHLHHIEMSDVYQGNHLHTSQGEHPCTAHERLLNTHEFDSFNPNMNMYPQQGHPNHISLGDFCERFPDRCFSPPQWGPDTGVPEQDTLCHRPNFETEGAFISDEDWQKMRLDKKIRHLNERI